MLIPILITLRELVIAGQVKCQRPLENGILALMVHAGMMPVLYPEEDSSNRRLPYKTGTEVMDLLLHNWKKIWKTA